MNFKQNQKSNGAKYCASPEFGKNPKNLNNHRRNSEQTQKSDGAKICTYRKFEKIQKPNQTPKKF